jgi:hypothetical protein
MQTIEIQTLVDITNTKVTRLVQGSQLQLDQNRNFITLLQCIELRSIVSYDEVPNSTVVDIKGAGFGTSYKGKHNVWTFKVVPDREGVYTDELGNPIGGLISDLNGVPVLKNLKETININTAIFDLNDSQYKNTIVRVVCGED